MPESLVLPFSGTKKGEKKSAGWVVVENSVRPQASHGLGRNTRDSMVRIVTGHDLVAPLGRDKVGHRMEISVPTSRVPTSVRIESVRLLITRTSTARAGHAV